MDKIKPQYFFLTLSILQITLPFLPVHTWALHYRAYTCRGPGNHAYTPSPLFMWGGGGRAQREGLERRLIWVPVACSFISLGWRGRRNSSGGGWWSERGWDGTSTLSKLGRKYHHDWMYARKWPSSVYVLSSLWRGRSPAMQAAPHHGRKKLKDSLLTCDIPARKPLDHLVTIYSFQVAFFGVHASCRKYVQRECTVLYVMTKNLCQGSRVCIL